MDTQSIIITTLREKEKLMESQLNELRDFINRLISGAAVGVTTGIVAEPDNTIIASNSQEKRKYNSEGRKKKGEAIEEVARIMRESGKFMIAADIAKLVNMERSRVSSIMSVAAKDGKKDVAMYMGGVSKSSTVWGFKDWLGDDGKPLPERI